MLTRIDPATVTLRPASLFEAWLVGLESDEFRQIRRRMADGGNGKCVWEVFRTVCQRAQMSEREVLDAMVGLVDVERRAGKILGFSGIAEANDEGVGFPALAQALRQAEQDMAGTSRP